MESHFFNGSINYQWPFSIATLNYQSVTWFHQQTAASASAPCESHWKTSRRPFQPKPPKKDGEWIIYCTYLWDSFNNVLVKKNLFCPKNWHCACYHGLVWKQGTPNVHGLKLTLSHENSHKLTTVGCKSSISETRFCYPCLQPKVRPMTLSYRQSVQPMRRPERCGTDTGASRSCRAMAMKRQSKPTTCQCEAIVGICWNMLKYVGICWNHMQDIAVNCKCIEFDRWRLDIGGPTNYCNCM